MANDFFQFQKFMIRQDKCAMKVGTDGVLIGAWTSVDDCKTILDVGTGTGLIALMLAQRSSARIDAIDIDPDAIIQAEKNVFSSPFANFIRIYHTSFGDFIEVSENKYDLIISNPPYFVDSLQSPSDKRNKARHITDFSFMDLIGKGKTLLNIHGRIAFIIPYEQEKVLKDTVDTNQMRIIRRTNIYPTPDSTPKRLLIELSTNLSAPTLTSDLIIEEARHQYSTDYRALTKDFYLIKD